MPRAWPIRQWPRDRTHYTRVVDRLDRAGARTIAFDVDFSARSSPTDDARFAGRWRKLRQISCFRRSASRPAPRTSASSTRFRSRSCANTCC
ncbi:CHASE2 domain-containing protein [Qipengyuania sp. MTN3-11]|uniref:CHASE2 domain-containing protein n=1 Tax=Qipengyuania sp. MTN3-11 TaxID=3056557 RepID=UPI0036F2E2CE